MADDDEDDCELVTYAARGTQLEGSLRFVTDGQDLIDYLRKSGAYRDAPGARPAPRPALILLDLNMPRKDGLEALAEIRSDAALREIPVIVLTTSKDDQDVLRSYQLGANSYITKPAGLADFKRLVGTLAEYWLELVELPKRLSAQSGA
jgi:CheY-like chemotaxis protein